MWRGIDKHLVPCLKHREGYSLFAAQEATRNFVGHAGQFIGHEVAASSVDHVVNELFNNTVSGLGERWVIKRNRERLLRPPGPWRKPGELENRARTLYFH